MQILAQQWVPCVPTLMRGQSRCARPPVAVVHMLKTAQGTIGHTVTLAARLVAHCLRRLRYAAFGALGDATCACVPAWLIPVCPTRVAVTDMSCTMQSTGGHTVNLVVRPMARYLRQFS